MDTRAREVLRQGDSLFSTKTNIDSLWQEIALNFYPERADFTYKRNEGEEFSDHLFSSYPVLARRELGNMLAAGLRPSSQKWFSIHVDDEELDNGIEERQFLENLANIQWRAMYNDKSNFIRCTNQADHDFVTFGNAVIKFSLNSARNGLLFQNFHLKNCAWSDNAEGKVDVMHRNWSPSARQLKAYFPNTISKQVREACEKDPEKPFRCRHVVLPSRLYHYRNNRGKEFPFVSLYVETESSTVLEEVGQQYFGYVVPRWETIADTAYAVSMATAIMLPDGRTSQVLMRTMLEAGEKYVDPPMIAVGDAVRGDYALYAGGITIADIEYDERLGDVLRPVTQDKGGMPIGFDIANTLKEDIRAGFFLDKIQLPEAGVNMTAFEVRRRLEEHIRSSAPIYEPIEKNYSSPICEGVFDLLRDNGAFPLDTMPESLAERNIDFKFRSPLADMAEQSEVQTFLEGMNTIVGPAAQIDRAQMAQVNLTQATRDALVASGFKAKWLNPIEAVGEEQQRIQQMQKMQQVAGMAQQAGQVAQDGGAGIEALLGAAQGAQGQEGVPLLEGPPSE